VLLALVPLALAVQAPAPADALTSRNTPGRTGAATFGKVWTLYADGQIVTQPLLQR
jgi:hypothetical protein